MSGEKQFLVEFTKDRFETSIDTKIGQIVTFQLSCEYLSTVILYCSSGHLEDPSLSEQCLSYTPIQHLLAIPPYLMYIYDFIYVIAPLIRSPCMAL